VACAGGGIMDAIMLGLINSKTSFPATNLLQNGDFGNGIAGWAPNLCTATAANNKCVCTVTVLGESCGIYTLPAPSYISGHTYYAYGEISPKYSVKARISIFGKLRYIDATAGMFNRASHVATNNGETSGLSFYHDTRTQYAIGDQFELRNMLLVDLTAAFGVGNEPTRQECDIIFSEWFDKTKNPLMTPQEVMAFCLKELHDIKTAIIALGGQV
jgi:hypothetical protein